MTPDLARAMARYNRWMNEKLYAVAAKLTDAEYKQDRGAFFGSIHRTLNHVLVGDRVWLGRFTGVAPGEGEMAPGIQTVYVAASPRVRHIAANLVRAVVSMGGDPSPFVSKDVLKRLKGKSPKAK